MNEEKSQKKMLYLHEQISEFEKLDIEHKRTKDISWNEVEEKYRHQLERGTQGACIVQDGKIKLVNKKLLKLLGYSRREFIDSLFMHFVLQDELPKLAKMYGKRLAGEDVPSIYKTVGRHKDGSKIHVEVNSGIISFKGKPATLAIIRYLIKQKQS
jgi:PAS domain S-box-containing protein